MAEAEITCEYLEALSRYLKGEINSREAASVAGLSGANRFLEFMHVAFNLNYISVNAPINQEVTNKMRDWAGFERRLEPKVVRGNPNDDTFYLRAAETLMIHLRRYLTSARNEVNIGIVSGSSTANTINRLVESALWDEIMGGVSVSPKNINVIALNATTVTNWELEGNANISTLKLAVLLRDNLCENDGCSVNPKGISKDLIVRVRGNGMSAPGSSDGRTKTITVDKEVTPGLDIVISGVGAPDNSVFSDVLRILGIDPPKGIVGDIAFWPVDRNGKPLKLVKDGVEYQIYCEIDLTKMRDLVTRGSVVMVIARNSRRGRPADKTNAIRAAIRGNYVNVMFTDEDTAVEVMKEPAAVLD